MQAHDQELILWRAGAHTFLQAEYDKYTALHRQAHARFLKERSLPALFINYDDVIADYGRVIAYGNSIGTQLESLKLKKANSIKQQVTQFSDRLARLRQASTLINEGRLARKSLTQAELMITEVTTLLRNGDFHAAESRLQAIPPMLEKAEKALTPIIGRYSDEEQVRKWRNWVDDTINESARNRSKAIIVNKIRKTLQVYSAGKVIKTYPVELGLNGTRDKLYSGDKATPEGRYKITKKIPNSKFYKALLINYPNQDDIKAFNIAKKQGLIPKNRGIGSLIEIHGGGDDSLTEGCVSMENSQMDELYNMVGVDTPVTIVGAVNVDNPLAGSLSGELP